MAFVCQFCSFCCSSWRVVLRHTFEAHSGPNLKYTCGIDNCPQTFTTLSAATSHWARKHKGRDFGIQGTETCANSNNSTGEDAIIPDNDEQQQADLPGTLGMEDQCELERSRRSAGLFLLTLKERYQLTQTALNFAVGQVKQMVEFLSDDIRLAVEATVEQHCASAGVDAPDLESCFQDIDPFYGLETEYMQTKFYKENFGLVVSYLILTARALVAGLCYPTCLHCMCGFMFKL